MAYLIIPFSVYKINEMKGSGIMKNPNGFGSVVKLKGNRRRPFAVRKTIGWNEKGHPIYLPIGYTTTREEGMILLAEYNKCPWDIDSEKVTLEMLYNEWLEKKTAKLGKSSISSLKSAFKHTKKYWNMKYKEMKSFHFQDAIDNCGCGYSTQWAIKNLFGHLDKFALEMDIINKGYAQLTTAKPIPETTKTPFSDDEIQALWNIKDTYMVDTILIFIYSGFRISELLNLKIENIDLEQKTFQGGTKTTSGKNRIVPIHSLIFELVQNRYLEGNTYLFSQNGRKFSSSQYYTEWNKIMDLLELKHTPHDCRHTFRSKLDSVGANKKCIDMMMGHKSKDVGERVYTHKTLDELRTAIELITS